MGFKKGDRAMWSHTLPAVYGKDMVLKRSAVEALDPKAVAVTVVKVENKAETLIRVRLDKKQTHRDTTIKADQSGELVLTSDELIRVEEEK
jgi:hypothetical protein